jgi:membrane protease YdiL (CAAX protease family)
LALVAFEARRSALVVAQWLDDGEEFARETAAWRAALAFAAFQGAQILAGRILQTWTSDPAMVLAGSYTTSGVLLVVLTLYGRRELAPLNALPRQRASYVLAACGGLLSAAIGLATARWLLPEAARELDPDLMTTPAGRIGFVLAIGTVAPLVEELFFRGWLQHAIASELEPRRPWIAPVVTALAFASVHPAPSFPAVLALGLVTGVLYAKTASLAPCVIAHSVHNWAVVLLR